MSAYALGGFVFGSKLAVKEHARAIRAHLRLLSREAHENLARTKKEESCRFASAALNEISLPEENQGACKEQ
jgi:hypothetical protein